MAIIGNIPYFQTNHLEIGDLMSFSWNCPWFSQGFCPFLSIFQIPTFILMNILAFQPSPGATPDSRRSALRYYDGGEATGGTVQRTFGALWRIRCGKSGKRHGKPWVIKCPHFSHHPTMIGINGLLDGYYKVMSNIPKMGHLPTPENLETFLETKCHGFSVLGAIICHFLALK